LPALAGVLLILGTVRKELVLIGAVAILGTTNLVIQPEGFTAVQLVVMALVAMLYIPCVSTVAILAKEFGWKPAIIISLANIFSAIIIGGLAFRLLALFF
jgi:ferrous iron transport protein B